MPDDFDEKLEAALDAADKAINEGPYKKALRNLLALSMEGIKDAVPKASFSDYKKLLSVVEQASAANIAPAELKDKIASLGSTAINIAKLVPSLAALFA